MKVTLKGNTSKTKKYMPATENQPAMLFFDVCEKVKRRDGSEEQIWYRVAAIRGYADTNYRLLHGEEEVSRFVQVEGRIIKAPEVKTGKNGQVYVTTTIWADEITYLDDKWPKNESPLPEATEEVPDVADEETPW